jgi:hypothetical protein
LQSEHEKTCRCCMLEEGPRWLRVKWAFEAGGSEEARWTKTAAYF